jgi:hypothetical protein
MKERGKKIILNIIGVYFLILGIIAISLSLIRQMPTQILYACYIGIILIGIGILTRKGFLILSQIYIITIPSIFWAIDFLHWLIFKTPLWGMTDYFFFNSVITIDKFVSLQHFYAIPLAIYAAKLIGKEKNAWKLSLIQLVIIFIAVKILSPSELNINCVFYSCININWILPYNLVWFLVSFSIVGITALLLNYFLWPKKRK